MYNSKVAAHLTTLSYDDNYHQKVDPKVGPNASYYDYYTHSGSPDQSIVT